MMVDPHSSQVERPRLLAAMQAPVREAILARRALAQTRCHRRGARPQGKHPNRIGVTPAHSGKPRQGRLAVASGASPWDEGASKRTGAPSGAIEPACSIAPDGAPGVFDSAPTGLRPRLLPIAATRLTRNDTTCIRCEKRGLSHRGTGSTGRCAGLPGHAAMARRTWRPPGGRL